MNVDFRKPFWLIQGDPEKSDNWMVLETFSTVMEAEKACDSIKNHSNPLIARQGVFVYQIKFQHISTGQ